MAMSLFLTSWTLFPAIPLAQEIPAFAYSCHTVVTGIGTAANEDMLTIDKVFEEDGSVQYMTVRWEGHGEPVVRRTEPTDQAYVALTWLGNAGHHGSESAVTWRLGTIAVTYFARANRHETRKGERWWQVAVDRDNALQVRIYNGDRLLMGDDLQLGILGNPVPFSSNGRLQMSVDSLVAWGTGATRVTVYETVVTPQKPRGREWPTPIGLRRIVTAYEVDTQALGQIAAAIREAVVKWEATLTDPKAQCTRVDNPKGEIVVTRS